MGIIGSVFASWGPIIAEAQKSTMGLAAVIVLMITVVALVGLHRTPRKYFRPAFLRGSDEAAISCHSTTSSARASIEDGIVRPNAFAVLRLRTISNLVGCRTGKSAGCSPLRMRPA